VWFLLAGAATSALYLAQGRTLQAVTYESVALLSAAAIVVGSRLHATPHAAAWNLLAGGLALFGLGDIVYSAHESLAEATPFPSIADVVYLAAYPLLIAGVLRMVRHRLPGLDLASLLDAVAIAVAVGIPYWVFIVSPLALDAGMGALARAVSLAYPVLDLVLVAAAARLAFAGGRRTVAGGFLFAGLAAQLVADTLYGLPDVSASYRSGGALDLLYLGSYLLLGAAALHPSMLGVTTPVERAVQDEIPRWRVAALGLAVVSAPVMLAVERSHDHPQHVYGVIAGWVVLMVCLLGRFVGVLRRLSEEASVDPLTRLPNRERLVSRLDALLVSGARDVAVLYVDVDGFRTVNARLGHARGDEVLIGIAERLSSAVRPGDVVARIGADEFVVLCERVVDEAAARAVADRLTGALAVPFWIDESPFFLSAAIGIARPGPNDRAEPLVRDAADAMRRAKAAGRSRTAVADPSRRDEESLRVRFERDLYDAVGRDELVLHFQPQVDLVTGVVVGVEALVRWHHPQWGTTKPETLLPVAEETGLIVPIGRWVLDHACEQHDRWEREDPGCAPREIAVNVSQRELVDPGFVPGVQQVLRRSGLAPDQLVVEVSDRWLGDAVPVVGQVLNRLRGMGVHVCIDEVGVGAGSLHNLRRFDADRAKLDRSFVAAIADDPGARLVASSVLHLAESLGVTLVAAGVETRSQRTHLQRLGFTLAQGNLWAPPLPPGGVLQSVFGRASG